MQIQKCNENKNKDKNFVWQEPDGLQIVERLLDLAKKHNIAPTALALSLGLAKSTFSDWKGGRIKPSVNALVKMSSYFHVSLDYLITGHEFGSGLEATREERAWMLLEAKQKYEVKLFDALSEYREALHKIEETDSESQNVSKID